jgi:hypothetical protein
MSTPITQGTVQHADITSRRVYDAKLDGKSVQLQVTGMGLVSTHVKSGKKRTILFQSLLSWETAKGTQVLELWTREKEVLRFTCADNIGQCVAAAMELQANIMAKTIEQRVVDPKAPEPRLGPAPTGSRVKMWDAKLKGKKVQLLVGNMGVEMTGRGAGPALQTFVYQSMQSWGHIPGKGIEIVMHDGISVILACDEGDKICYEIGKRALNLIDNGALTEASDTEEDDAIDDVCRQAVEARACANGCAEFVGDIEKTLIGSGVEIGKWLTLGALNPAEAEAMIAGIRSKKNGGNLTDRLKAMIDQQSDGLIPQSGNKYNAKLDGRRVQLQVTQMGLVMTDAKGENPQTFLLQSMLSWEPRLTGLQMYTKDKTEMFLECGGVQAKQIAEVMRVNATALVTHNVKPPFDGALEEAMVGGLEKLHRQEELISAASRHASHQMVHGTPTIVEEVAMQSGGATGAAAERRRGVGESSAARRRQVADRQGVRQREQEERRRKSATEEAEFERQKEGLRAQTSIDQAELDSEQQTQEERRKSEFWERQQAKTQREAQRQSRQAKRAALAARLDTLSAAVDEVASLNANMKGAGVREFCSATVPLFPLLISSWCCRCGAWRGAPGESGAARGGAAGVGGGRRARRRAASRAGAARRPRPCRVRVGGHSPACGLGDGAQLVA